MEVRMQTFLPYPDFAASAAALDNKRLNKQIVEAMQILTANTNYYLSIKSGWQNHPAVKMWRDFNGALLVYRNACIDEWHSRGFQSHHMTSACSLAFPPWLGNEEFHRSHQSNLIRKDRERYAPMFPGVPDDLPYVWPV